MRRVLPILLLAAFLLPLFAPLLAFGQSGGDETRLPVCCRRNGQHHCAMGIAATAPGAPAWQSPAMRCPYSPASVSAGYAHETLAAPAAQAFYAGMTSHPAGSAQTEIKRHIALDRSRQKRGPPTFRS